MPTLAERAEKRLRTIYSSQKSRAKKFGDHIPYTVIELITRLLPLGHCPYCGDKLTPKGFQVDHTIPLARGGTWTLDNLQAICTSCNRRKHALTDSEFRSLLEYVRSQSEYVQRNILARLAAGGAWLASRF